MEIDREIIDEQLINRERGMVVLPTLQDHQRGVDAEEAEEDLETLNESLRELLRRPGAKVHRDKYYLCKTFMGENNRLW